jgi:hypothetical protein
MARWPKARHSVLASPLGCRGHRPLTDTGRSYQRHVKAVDNNVTAGAVVPVQHVYPVEMRVLPALVYSQGDVAPFQGLNNKRRKTRIGEVAYPGLASGAILGRPWRGWRQPRQQRPQPGAAVPQR